MTTLKFEGEINFGDGCRVAVGDELDGSIHVGGRDVIAEIEEANFCGPVTLGIANATFAGDLFVETGWGYSEYTPVESDALKAGAHDIVGVLERYQEGDRITVWIADEPVDLMTEVQSP
jgi:hypothetical protein